jgi:diguanylate cyclase (GGDEF)-like protein
MNTSFRVWLPIAIIFVLLFTFGTGIYIVLDRQAGYRRQEDSLNNVVRYSNSLLSQLKDAETGQRGFILTGAERYLAPFKTAQDQIPQTQHALHDAAAQNANPGLNDRISELDVATAAKMSELRETIALRREKGLDAATQMVMTDHGLQYMEDARTIAADITTIERGQLNEIIAKQNNLARRMKLLLVTAGPAILLLAMLGIRLATRRIARSIRLLEQAVVSMGSGGQPINIEIHGNDEFGRLAASFNSMAARLSAAGFAQNRAEAQLREKNSELAEDRKRLEDRTQALDILGRIAHRLPGCNDETEFSALIQRYIPQLFPGVPGALYLLNQSRTLLRALSQWNDPRASEIEFRPDDCWAMRRGQKHVNFNFGREVVCTHMNPDATDSYMCWPLTAHNETVGLLYLEHAAGTPFLVQSRFQDIGVLCETIALAFVNLRLRDSLRNQSIRDSLTGLFNRRYLEESLELEFSRAVRSKGSIAVILLDIDHFKKFNDTFGHGAGDLVIKHVGETLSRGVRKGDLACRYGGEEFMLVLVGATIEPALYRAEQVRNAVKELKLDYNGVMLGDVTVSIGVAIYPQCGATPADVIDAADKALYDAKKKGRDRVCEAPDLPPMTVLEKSAE